MLRLVWKAKEVKGFVKICLRDSVVNGGCPRGAASLGPLGEPDSFDLRNEDESDGLTTRVYEVSAGGRRLELVEELLADGRIESFEVHAAE